MPQLPSVAVLDGMRATSQLFSSLTILQSENATVNGSGHLILDGAPGAPAWIVFDLGTQAPAFSIGTVDFTNAAWDALNPPPAVFVGAAEYNSGRWRFRQAMPDGTPANFNSLTNTDFVSPTNHAYVVVVTTAAALDCGDDIDIQGASAPGGELPADFITDFPGMPGKFGDNNAIVIRPDNSGGDILTYCEDNAGGALVRFTYNDTTDEVAITVKTLYDPANQEPLAACHAYRPDYYPDGRLGIGAARRGPNSIREVKELTPNSLDFSFGSFQTAVDNTYLPLNFNDPQYDYQLDTDGNVHCIFKHQGGSFAYAGQVNGSGYNIDFGGPAILGSISMVLPTADDIVVAYQRLEAGRPVLAVRKLEQYPPNSNPLDFGDEAIVFNDAADEGGLAGTLGIGLGNSIHVAHTISRTVASTTELGFGYSDDGIIAGTWDHTVVDDGTTGGGDDSVGGTPSIGILSDGTPVVAYYDSTNQSLRLAISSLPDGGNVTGALWDSYRIDTSNFGMQVGVDPALGVIHRTAPDKDKIIVAYGVIDGSDHLMRIIVLDAPAAAT